MIDLYNYFRQNELIINLKKGKTETMLFGTSKRLSKLPSLSLTFNGVNITNTNHYKYLGATIDPSLTLNDNFDKLVKTVSVRLHQMRKMWAFLN